MVNNDTVITEVRMTRDYDKFKFIKHNRRLSARNYAKLIVSMKEEYLTIPILVNRNYEIIDGQHRFCSAKENGLPIYYFMVPDYGMEQVKRANMVSSTWNKYDFLDMHVSDENENYIIIRRMIDTYNVTINDLLKLFSQLQDTNINITSKQFEEGTISLEGKEMIENFLIAMEDFDFFMCYKHPSFRGAFMKLYFHPDYDHEVMKQRISQRKHVMTKKTNQDEYLQMLTKDVYSFGAVKKRLFYDMQTKKFYS